MFQKILVPLDGSKLAECALPYAEELAKGCNTEEVILISVTEHVKGFRPVEDPGHPSGQHMIPEAVGKKDIQAQRYLNKVAKGMEAKGIKVRTEVLLWPPAQAIVGYAEQSGADIIVMSSHGRSGPSRWTHGSIADNIFRASCIPVLMVKAPGCVIGI